VTDSSYVQTGLAFSFDQSIMAGLTDAGHLDDLHVGFPSAFVQVQNASPMPTTITIGADQWEVTAAQATTLPLPPDGAGIDYSTTNDFATEQFGTITVIWLLKGQLPPQPDGPLTGAAATGSSPGGGGPSRISQTFAVAGAIVVPSGSTGYLPGFYVPVPAGQTVTVAAAKYVVQGGTVDLDVQQNGSGITGLTGLSASSTPAQSTATGSPSVADGDHFTIVVNSVTPTPYGLTVSIYFDVTPS
jgi:hypothetical protein